MNDNEEFFDEESSEVRNAKATARRFMRTLWRQKGRLIIVLISVAFYTFFTIVAPMYSAKLVDMLWGMIKASAAGTSAFRITWDAGGRQIAILLALYLAGGIFYTLQSLLMASFAEKLNLGLRSEMGEKLQRLPLRYYDSHRAGEIMSHVTNDLDRLSDALQTGLLKLFTAIGTIIGSLAIMFSYDAVLTLVFLVFTALSLFLANLAARKTLKYSAERQCRVSELNGLVEEAYTGRSVIKAFNYEKRSTERVYAAADALAEASEKTDFIMYAVNPGVRIVNRCGQVVIAILGGLMLFDGKLTPGRFQAFFQYVNQAGEPLTEMSYMLNSLQSALASIERVYALLDEEEISPEPDAPAELQNVRGKVEFKSVRFGYSHDHPLMKGISFSALPGQKIAVVGSTGAGKTTLVNLLLRFYEIDGGEILLDGVDTRRLTRAALRNCFGMVLQDTWLFGGTIAENIAYGKPNATRAEIIAAAKAARADFFIRTMPRGYDTVLSNDAENISVGQRQLLTIARVMLRDPAILILDEATSSVDTRTELEISRAMDTLMEKRTSFVIAHRLSTIVDADLILLMQNGGIIEQGTHAELLKSGGEYAKLYNSQFA